MIKLYIYFWLLIRTCVGWHYPLDISPPITQSVVETPSTPFENAYLDALNEKRINNGLKPLKWSTSEYERLYDRVTYSEYEMNEYLDLWYSTKQANMGLLHSHKYMIQDCGWITENAQVQYKQLSPQDVVNAFYGSYSHRNTMLGDYEYFCVIEYNFVDKYGNNDYAYYEFYK